MPPATQDAQPGTDEPSRGLMAISKVVAAVRGMAMKGPMQRVLKRISRKDVVLSSCREMLFWKPSWQRKKARRARIARPTSARMNARKLISQLVPVTMPRAGGKIRLPAPKNMANRAKPRTNTLPKESFSFMGDLPMCVLYVHLQYTIPGRSGANGHKRIKRRQAGKKSLYNTILWRYTGSEKRALPFGRGRGIYMSELTVRMGENIRIYRRANRMTLSELATKINKSKATVGKYEQGTIALDMDTLYEIAAALGVSPFQLMVSLLPEKKEKGEPRLQGERRYLYLYDGRASRILRSLLVSGQEDDAVTLFYDIPSFTEPQRCRALYYGRRQKHDFVTNYILENQSNGVEHAFLCVMRSLDRPTESTGLISGISSRMLLPVSAKCILSEAVLPENEELTESLLLTKEDIRLTRRCNMFIVEQISWLG